MYRVKSTKPAIVGTKSVARVGLLSYLVAGVLGTIAFDVVMYTDIAATGLPLDISKVLGSMLVGESGAVDLAGHAFHFVNGIGLAFLYGYVFLRISRRIMRGHIWLHGVTFAVMVTVGPVWLVMLPALGAGIAGLGISPLVPVMTMVRHIAFGAVLGILVKPQGGK